MQFNIRDPSKYDGRFPNFRQPSEIGCFSLDGQRTFHDDSHQLKYIIMPHSRNNLSMDLNLGYADGIRKEFGKNERIDAMLTWILSHADKVKEMFPINPSTGNPNIDFVCFRGLLTTVCASVYENKDDWLICATKFKSVIYLCAFDTEDKIHRSATATERDKRMCAWGYKFEQFMSADSPDAKPNIHVPVNEKEEYCIMLKGRLNSHTLLFSAEIDGIDPSSVPKDTQQEPKSTGCYLELKTSRIITNKRQNVTFCRSKLLKWWLQSYLVGIPKIICGFRDDNGIVRDLDTFPIQSIPKMAQTFWSPASCLNFCSEFLDYIKVCVKKDDPSIVYKFYWRPGQPITCEELESPGEFQVLPTWYTSNYAI